MKKKIEHKAIMVKPRPRRRLADKIEDLQRKNNEDSDRLDAVLQEVQAAKRKFVLRARMERMVLLTRPASRRLELKKRRSQYSFMFLFIM